MCHMFTFWKPLTSLISESTTIRRWDDGCQTIPEGSIAGGLHAEASIIWTNDASTTSAVVVSMGCSSVISVTPPSQVSSPASATNRFIVSGSSVLSVLGANVMASGETSSTDDVS